MNREINSKLIANHYHKRRSLMGVTPVGLFFMLLAIGRTNMKCFICAREKEKTFPLETANTAHDDVICEDCIRKDNPGLGYNPINRTFFYGNAQRTVIGDNTPMKLPTWWRHLFTISHPADEMVLDPEFNDRNQLIKNMISHSGVCSGCSVIGCHRLAYASARIMTLLCDDCAGPERPHYPGTVMLTDEEEPESTTPIAELEEYRRKCIFTGDDYISKEETIEKINAGELAYSLSAEMFYDVSTNTVSCIYGKGIYDTCPTSRDIQLDSVSGPGNYHTARKSKWQNCTDNPRNLSNVEGYSKYLCKYCHNVSNKMFPVWAKDEVYLCCQHCAMDKSKVHMERISCELYDQEESEFIAVDFSGYSIKLDRRDVYPSISSQEVTPKFAVETSWARYRNVERCEECGYIDPSYIVRQNIGNVKLFCLDCHDYLRDRGRIKYTNNDEFYLQEDEDIYKIVDEYSTTETILKINEASRLVNTCKMCEEEGTWCLKTSRGKGRYCPYHKSVVCPKPNPENSTITCYHGHTVRKRDFLHTLTDYKNKEKTYFGIELEVEFNPERTMRRSLRDSVVEEILRVSGGMFYAESDSSLDNGKEFISVPMTMKYLKSKQTKETIKKMMNLIKEKGGRTDDNTHAGLHIHISKPSSERSIANYKKNMAWMVQAFKPEFELIAERPQKNYCKSMLEGIYKDFKRSGFAKAVIDKHSDFMPGERHSALNIEGHRGKTHELRIFKTTLSYDHLMAAVELTNALLKASLDRENYDKLTFGGFINRYGGVYLKKEYREKQLQQFARKRIPKEIVLE